MAETIVNVLGDQVTEVVNQTADTVASVLKPPVNFVQKALDGKLQIAGFKASELSNDLSALIEVNAMPNSIAGGVNALVGKAKGLRKTVLKNTGLDVDFGIETLGEQFNELIAPFSPSDSKGQLKEKFKNYLDSLTARVKFEIDDCIKKHLRALRNKIPALDIALDPELFVAKEIGKVRSMLQSKIDLAKSILL